MADLKKTVETLAAIVPPGVVVPSSVLQARREQRDRQRVRGTTIITAAMEA
jgi:hypothetical protein